MINVLILSGHNNHDWKRTTALFEKTLNDDGRFNVKVSYDPGKDLMYKEQLANVDVMVMDYNGDMWDRVAQENFAEAVANGTGLVAIHAANNWPAQGFKELEEMLVFVFTDESGHGEFHEFKVDFNEPDHPVLKGMEPFVNEDELYHNCINTQNVTGYKILAESYSDPAKGGTGNREPMIIENTYGKGKIIHNLLGHVWPYEFCPGYRGHFMVAVDNDNFRQLLVRSCLYTAGADID